MRATARVTAPTNLVSEPVMSMRCVAFATLSFASLVSSLAAQASWSEVLGLANIPPTRRESPGVADFTSMYVFGGQDGSGARLNDLWRFDGVAWAQLTADGAVGSPPGRSRAAIAYDYGRGRLVVFGGHDGSGVLGDTWEWDGVVWYQLTPANAPTARQFTAAAYDWVNGQVVLFGGRDGSGAYLNDTWAWDGVNWTQLSPSTVPPARQQHGMAARLDQFDIVMCCGQNASTRFGDTWLWNGADWSQVATTVSPQPRVAMDITYDEVRQRIVIPGGNNANLNPIGAIAEFDGTNWVNRPLDSTIGKRTRYFLAFVPSLGKSYMFGGQRVGQPLPTGTFEYQTDVVGSFSIGTVGLGCAGSNGVVPQLSAIGTPWIDDSFELVVTGLNPAAFAKVMFFDVLVPIVPVSLDAIGQVGCNLVANPVITVPIGATNSIVIDVPNDATLKGFAMFTQAVGLEVGPDVLGMSDRGDIVVGAR